MNYSEFERRVLGFFRIGSNFNYENRNYEVVTSGKPSSLGGGEPKTDVYVLAKATDDASYRKEFKISCKLIDENEFQENKIKAGRAEEIFGYNWSEIIQNAAESIRNRFEEVEIYFPIGRGRTRETMFTNGWKLEITNRERNLSCPLRLADQEIKDLIYKGTTLSADKKNARVNGNVILNSGVAEYILVSDAVSLESAEDVLQSMVLIDEYIIERHYMIFTANNLRVLRDASDGNRPLAVQVIWTASEDGQTMTHNIKYNSPLDPHFSGRRIADRTISEISRTNEEYRSVFI